MPQENKNTINSTKRKLLKTTAWSAPVVATISLPQHAQATAIEMVKVVYDFTNVTELSYGSFYGGWTVDGTDVASIIDTTGVVYDLADMAAIMNMDDPNSNTWIVSGTTVCATVPASIASQYGLVCSKENALSGCVPAVISELP